MRWRSGPRAQQVIMRAACVRRGGFLISIFFISVFYKNIFSIWKFTEIYPGRPAGGRSGPGRPAAGRQGLFRKKNTKNNCRQVPGTGRPAAGRPASHPYIKVLAAPHPPFGLLKIQKKRKEREG